jgi:hypothetical protein
LASPWSTPIISILSSRPFSLIFLVLRHYRLRLDKPIFTEHCEGIGNFCLLDGLVFFFLFFDLFLQFYLPFLLEELFGLA